MKIYLTILIIVSNLSLYGQFGIISDKDGSVNVRNSPSISKNIIDTLENGEIVFCLEEENEWLPIDYDFEKQNKSGYISKSRIKYIDKLESVKEVNLTESSISFKSDDFEINITKIKFNSTSNNLEYYIGNKSKNEATYLKLINGKKIWGTDGNIPKMQYGEIVVKFGKDKIQLPIENLYEPNIEYTNLHIDAKNKILYLNAINGDGAGGYTVLWIIENGKFKQRITTIPF